MSTLRDCPDLGLPHLHRGKVRDLFDAGDDRLLMVASDRLSAFDVVMDEPVPDKFPRRLQILRRHHHAATMD